MYAQGKLSWHKQNIRREYTFTMLLDAILDDMP